MAEQTNDSFREVIDFVRDSNRDANRERSTQGDNLQSMVNKIEDSVQIQNIQLKSMEHHRHEIMQVQKILEKDLQISRDQARSLSNLWMAVNTGELGKGKLDPLQLAVMEEMEGHLTSTDYKLQRSQTEKLEQIRRSTAASEMTFRERFDRFFTNNIKAFGSISTGFARLFGANIYDRNLAEKNRDREQRHRELEEASYNISFLAYKFLVTEQVAEMREQTDLLRILVRRSPSLAQQEEDRMESRRRARSFQMPDDIRAETLAGQEAVEKGLLSRVMDGLLGGIVVSAAPLITKLKDLKAGLVAKTKGAVVGFISRIFGLSKFGKVAGPVGAILGLIETGKDVFDIASAVTDEDVRTKVMAKDVGGVVGSILGGALGFAIGGPVGAAVGVSLGNSIGGYIGGLMDNKPINEAIAAVIEKLETQLETASGAEKKRIEAEIKRLQNLQDTDGQTLKQYEKDLEAAYAKRIEARTDLENALKSGDGRLIAKADLALNAANKVVSDAEQRYVKFEKQLTEKARKASDELLDEMMSFQDRFANSKNAAVAFFGRVMGGTTSDRGQLDARRIELKELREETLEKGKSSIASRALFLRKAIRQGQIDLRNATSEENRERTGNLLKKRVRQFLSIANMGDLTTDNLADTLASVGIKRPPITRNLAKINELTSEVETLRSQLNGTAAPAVIDNSVTSGPAVNQMFNQQMLQLFAEDPEMLKSINAMLGR